MIVDMNHGLASWLLRHNKNLCGEIYKVVSKLF